VFAGLFTVIMIALLVEGLILRNIEAATLAQAGPAELTAATGSTLRISSVYQLATGAL